VVFGFCFLFVFSVFFALYFVFLVVSTCLLSLCFFFFFFFCDEAIQFDNSLYTVDFLIYNNTVTNNKA